MTKYCKNNKCSRRFKHKGAYEDHLKFYAKNKFCNDRRQIGTPITNKLYKEIEKYIKENKYTSISNFLRVAIKNQIKSGASS